MKSFLEQYPSAKTEILKAAEVAGYLWQKGWAERNGGNITVNITELVDTDKLSAVPAIGPTTPIGMTLPHLKGTFFFCTGTNRRQCGGAHKLTDDNGISHIVYLLKKAAENHRHCKNCQRFQRRIGNQILIF